MTEPAIDTTAQDPLKKGDWVYTVWEGWGRHPPRICRTQVQRVGPKETILDYNLAFGGQRYGTGHPFNRTPEEAWTRWRDRGEVRRREAIDNVSKCDKLLALPFPGFEEATHG